MIILFPPVAVVVRTSGRVVTEPRDLRFGNGTSPPSEDVGRIGDRLRGIPEGGQRERGDSPIGSAKPTCKHYVHDAFARRVDRVAVFRSRRVVGKASC